MKYTVEKLWETVKAEKIIPLGPISVKFRLSRTIRVSNNFLRWVKGKYLDHNHQIFNRHHQNSDGVITEKTTQKANSFISENGKKHSPQMAVIVGVNNGLGAALAEHLASEGMDLALVTRNAEKLDGLGKKLSQNGNKVCIYGCDATHEESYRKVLKHIQKKFGIPHLVIYSAQGFGPGKAIEVTVSSFEESWKQNCLGAFIVSKLSAQLMVARGSGSIIFLGSTSGIIGREDHLNLVVGKFGLRGLSQVMARELHPLGIHVAHLIIDGTIGNGFQDPEMENRLFPQDISQIITFLHNQPRSTWTQEMDIRPCGEKFWEHC